MKFLVDECLSPATASALRDSDFEAIHVTDLGLAGRSDDQVMAATLAQGQVIGSAQRGAIAVILDDRIRIRRLPIGAEAGLE